MDENQEVQETSETPAEPIETLATPEAVDASKFQELAEKNKKLFARAKQAEEDVKKYKEQLAKPPVAPSAPVDDIDAVLELRSKGFSDGEIRDLRQKAKKYNTTVGTLVSDEDLLAGLEAKRAKARVEATTPPPSGRISVVETAADLQKTPTEERAQKFSFEAWRSRRTGTNE